MVNTVGSFEENKVDMRFYILLKRFSCVFIGQIYSQNHLHTQCLQRTSGCYQFYSCITSPRRMCCTLLTLQPQISHQPTVCPDFSILRPRQAKSTMANGDRPSTISFQDYDALGFDLDHTIAKYKLVTLFNIGYECVTKFLVDEKGYDASIKEGLHDYKDFICKGLFLDVCKGNILKLGPDGAILRATHGTKLLPAATVQKVYGKHSKWEHFDTVQKTMRNGPNEFRFFENYFDCPALVATARIVDLIDQKCVDSAERQKLYTKAWEDALLSLHNMYNPNNFSVEKGGYFVAVKKDPWKFVEECSKDIRRWLKSLRQEGKIVFLLTSSQIDYASCLLKVCLGDDWQSYFDISLFRGRKPAFFTDNNPFYTLENDTEGVEVKDLQAGGCYSQGNLEDFNKFLSKQLGKKDVKVLYFGDNICADCYPSKQFSSWDAVLILEEMDAEGYECTDHTVPGHDNDEAENNALGPSSKKKKILEHSSLVTQEEIDYLITDFWGPFLIDKETVTANPKETFWGNVIVKYSDIAVPSLEYLAGVPLDHRFERFNGTHSSVTGYHPGRPSSLLS